MSKISQIWAVNKSQTKQLLPVAFLSSRFVYSISTALHKGYCYAKYSSTVQQQKMKKRWVH